jgi:hypothetical protein
MEEFAALACPGPIFPPQEFSASADKKEVASSPGLKPVAGTPKQLFRFVARQPILNREQQVFGYELLFRDGIESSSAQPTPRPQRAVCSIARC